MPRSLFRQAYQIRQSGTFDDTLGAGATLESGSTSLESDLNALRSQISRIIDDSGGGNWYDAIPTVNSKTRSLLDLNTDLDGVETKLFLFRSQVLTDVTVPAAQNWVVLSVVGSEAPSETAAIVTTTEGAVVAQATAFGGHNLDEITGPSALRPRNLCVIRNAAGDAISSGGKQVYGLLQSEVGTDGHTFNDTTQQVQISFVRENAGGTDLEAVPVADIQSTVINYSYVRRVEYSNIPQDAFLSGVFVDQAASVDVTLQNALDNQSGAVSQTNSIEVQIADGQTWEFTDSTGLVNLIQIAPTGGGDTVAINGDTFDVNSTTVDFSSGVSVATGGTQINVGTSPGVIGTAAGDLDLVSASALGLDDGNRSGSTYTTPLDLSSNTTEWNNFVTNFSNGTTLLGALNSLAGAAGLTRTKAVAVLTSNVAADTDVSGPGGAANLDVNLLDYSGVTFTTDVDVYLNGQLLRNGANAAANNDVYPGTDPTVGELRFEFGVNATPAPADVLTMIVYAN